MSKRPRTQQLEDISIQFFEGLLPPEWVCRRKDKDYGIDLEVEIFNTDGGSTGLLFYVQLKATDDLAKERSVNMQIDRLEFFGSFDAPSIIARYCDVNKKIYWTWVTNIFAKNKKPTTTSFTVKFEESELWQTNDPESIVRTLKVFRTINLGSRNLPIGITVEKCSETKQSSFELRRAVSRILDLSYLIIQDDGETNCLPVNVKLQDNFLISSVDSIASISLELERRNHENIFEQLTYVLAFMAIHYEFRNQAKDLSRMICDHELVCTDRSVSGVVASGFADEPSTGMKIAELNKLYSEQDQAFMMYIQKVLSCKLPKTEKTDAVISFYNHAIDAHGESAHLQAPIHYSLGNFLREVGKYKLAIRQFNLARKKDNTYLDRDYFISELRSGPAF